ncbi:flagellar protein FlaG [Asticcacaulis sp. YBE204]|uniref:flagellar protein FlaG n=1 Tax=Asticcacaulis sp. YBE204 TaxID=1282363 RepID=UPI00042093A3|nr:flagellar protein FlaG [Asticcacaulis sp. YBE204]
MINNVVSFPPATDLSQVAPIESVKPVKEVAPADTGNKTGTESDLSNKAKSESQPAYMLKLTIEQDPDSGEFIYRAIDRYTGEVVRQFPQKELMGMRESKAYQAGTLLKTDI